MLSTCCAPHLPACRGLLLALRPARPGVPLLVWRLLERDRCYGVSMQTSPNNSWQQACIGAELLSPCLLLCIACRLGLPTLCFIVHPSFNRGCTPCKAATTNPLPTLSLPNCVSVEPRSLTTLHSRLAPYTLHPPAPQVELFTLHGSRPLPLQNLWLSSQSLFAYCHSPLNRWSCSPCTAACGASWTR